MSKIVGNVVGIPNPQSDFNQADPTKADYIKNKPTTLSGYGITDAYTKSEVDKKISSGGGGEGVPTHDPEFTGTLKIGGSHIYTENTHLALYNPTHRTCIALGDRPYYDDARYMYNIYHEGNLKVLTGYLDDPLTETEKANVMRNTGLDSRLNEIEANISNLGTMLGEMDAAIDEILELQEAHINGSVEDLPLWQGGSY